MVIKMKKIGVIFADTQEYLPFLKYVKDLDNEKSKAECFITAGCKGVKYTYDSSGKEIYAINSGIGKVNAANAAAILIYKFGAEAILNAGLSGAVSKLHREDIVAGTSYVECDFDLTAIGYDLAVKPDGEEYIHSADEELLEYAMNVKSAQMKKRKLGTGDIFLADSEKKLLFKEKFDISAFDMESAAIASVCSRADLPFLSVRKISDDADDASADDYREMNNRLEDILTRIVLEIIEQII